MIIAALLTMFFQVPALQEEPVPVLGVLETPQAEEAPAVMARLLFHRIQGSWKPLVAEEARRQPAARWMVAYQGRALGRVELAPVSSEEAGLRLGLLRSLVDPAMAPRLPCTPGEFGGWLRTADRRPLVIQPTHQAIDPDGWKPERAPEGFKAKLWPALKRAWGAWRPVHCPRGSERALPLRIRARDLVVPQAFRSRDGRWVVAVGLELDRYGCDGVVDPEWFPHWFLMDQGSIRFLGRELTWVDAGNFGNTGRSDILFAHSGYNEDGYVLWSAGLRERAEVRWTYH